MKIAVIGEILWDVFPDRELLGGAPFNFAYHSAQLGAQVEFISAVGDDERGRRAREAAEQTRVSTRNLQTTDQAPTGRVTVRLGPGGEPDYVIHRPAAADFVDPSRVAGIEQSDWFYYGTLNQTAAGGREATRSLGARIPRAERLYDVNLRKDSYTPELVAELASEATLVKLNESEAAELGGYWGVGIDEFGPTLIDRFELRGVCVTRGERGCRLWLDGAFASSPGVKVECRDAVGAGDAFAAGLLHAIGRGASVREAAEFANRVGALVASRPGGTPDWAREELGP